MNYTYIDIDGTILNLHYLIAAKLLDDRVQIFMATPNNSSSHATIDFIEEETYKRLWKYLQKWFLGWEKLIINYKYVIVVSDEEIDLLHIDLPTNLFTVAEYKELLAKHNFDIYNKIHLKAAII